MARQNNSLMIIALVGIAACVCLATLGIGLYFWAHTNSTLCRRILAQRLGDKISLPGIQHMGPDHPAFPAAKLHDHDGCRVQPAAPQRYERGGKSLPQWHILQLIRSPSRSSDK